MLLPPAQDGRRGHPGEVRRIKAADDPGADYADTRDSASTPRLASSRGSSFHSGVRELGVGEDLEVQEAIPAQGVQDRPVVDRAVAREDAVVRVPRRLAPVGQVDADDAVAVALDLLERLVPEMPGVVHQPDVRAAGLRDQLRRLVERADDRPEVSELLLDRLHGDPDADRRGRIGDVPDALDDGLPILAGAGQEQHRVRLERREAPDPGADRLDPLRRILRPLHQRQRQDRGHLGDGDRRIQPAGPEAAERVVGKLHLPDPDPVGACVLVGVEVVGERLPDRGDLGDRVARHQRRTSPRARSVRDGFRSCWATSAPEPPPSPGPGCVLAPTCQTPGTGVR